MNILKETGDNVNYLFILTKEDGVNDIKINSFMPRIIFLRVNVHKNFVECKLIWQLYTEVKTLLNFLEVNALNII